ncbi:MAG: hypothetical protein KAT32_02900 [Candidatus Moranbacteria bacterium]|nr:hypothetical protein [Candidatus Moranbacteria bacterium]
MECQNNEKSTIISTLSEMVGSMLKVVQTGIVERIEKVASRIVRDVVGVIIFALLGLVGFTFFLVGASIWLGDFSGLGLGFGLMSTGGVVFILALLIGLIQRIK